MEQSCHQILYKYHHHCCFIWPLNSGFVKSWFWQIVERIYWALPVFLVQIRALIAAATIALNPRVQWNIKSNCKQLFQNCDLREREQQKLLLLLWWWGDNDLQFYQLLGHSDIYTVIRKGFIILKQGSGIKLKNLPSFYFFMFQVETRCIETNFLWSI